MTYLSSLLGLIVFAAVVLAVALSSEPDGEPRFPDAQPFSAEQLKQVHEIREGVSRLRGLPVAEDVAEGTVTRDVLRDFYDSAFDDLTRSEQRSLEVQSRAFRLLGLLGPGDDITAVYKEFGTEGIAGFYVPDEKRLIVIADQLGLSQELTIAHEYVHSFQDAKYDLQAQQKRGQRDRQSELARTIPCVYEGDATLASVLYMNSKHGSTWIREVQDSTANEGSTAAAPDLPVGMLRYFVFNYNECVRFAVEVFLKRGWNGIDGLYINPPTTTEQILHSDKYFEGEGASRVETRDLRHILGAGWKQLDGWAFGEFDVYN